VTQISGARARPENAALCSPATRRAQARNLATAALLPGIAVTQPITVVSGTATMAPAIRDPARVAVF
jgi:hypothetical protein